MDLHEVWQENKRWILGVAAGGLLFWIATSVIASTYDTSRYARQIAKDRASVSGDQLYGNAAQSAVLEEQRELEAAVARLWDAQRFVAGDEFQLEGKGDPDLHFDQVSRRVKRDLVTRAAALGVELGADDLEWTAPVGEAIQPALHALALLEHFDHSGVTIRVGDVRRLRTT